MRRRAPGVVVACATVAAVAACGSTPPTLTGAIGDRWTLPLVGALEDGQLITPVTIGSHGPYLFALEPDAATSAVDGELVREAELRTVRRDAQGRVVAALVGMELGSLILDRHDAIVARPHAFDATGRRIHGVLGRDLLGAALVVDVDRDRGIATLTLANAFRPPAGAIAIAFEEVPAAVTPGAPPPPSRRIVRARVGGQEVPLHVDLAAIPSQLRPALWPSAGLVARDTAAVVVDDTGVPRAVKQASDPIAVTLGAASSPRVAFVPYDDARWPDDRVAGTLGLGFFAPFRVWLDPDARTLYLQPRATIALRERLARWETGPLLGCTAPGCVTVRLIDPLNGQPPAAGRPHPGLVLSITRDEKAGGMPLEVMLADFARPELPRLLINLPPTVDRVIDHLGPEFLGAALVVVDASPYPRDCPGHRACIDKLTR